MKFQNIKELKEKIKELTNVRLYKTQMWEKMQLQAKLSYALAVRDLIDDLIGWSPLLCNKCYEKVRDELENLKTKIEG